jgi:polyferredoxin
MEKQFNIFPFFSGIITVRRTIQLIFLIITLFIGIKFYWFVAQLESGGVVNLERPPGVEAFLPISALVSLKYFLFTGIFNRVHPSALVIFLIICSTAFVFKKGFCSWICPFGLLSDVLADVHSYLFKKQIPWTTLKGIDPGKMKKMKESESQSDSPLVGVHGLLPL